MNKSVPPLQFYSRSRESPFTPHVPDYQLISLNYDDRTIIPTLLLRPGKPLTKSSATIKTLKGKNHG